MKKLIMTSVAAVAVAAMIGGGTFATWSDFQQSNDHSIGAGTLKLNLNGANGTSDSSSVRFTKQTLSPGVDTETRIWVSSIDPQDANSKIRGDISLSILNLEDLEDAATCSTNSEAVAEGSAVSPVDLAVCGTAGEFTENANVKLEYFTPIKIADFEAHKASVGSPNMQCDGYAKNVLGYSTVGTDRFINNYASLDAFAAGAITLGTDVAPGYAVCSVIVMNMPASAGNVAQGDHANFDMQFDLVQS